MSLFLSASELSRVRAAAECGLPDTCSVWRSAVSIGDSGGAVAGAPAKVYPTTGTTPCAVVPVRAFEREAGGMVALQGHYAITLSSEASVAVGDEIRVTGGDSYHVNAVPPTSDSPLITIDCVRI